MNHKEIDIIVNKIPLQVLIDSLVTVYDSGMDFIDLIITRTPNQDKIGIIIREEYVSPDREDDDDKLSDEDLNDLMEN